jgi:hypothetical protein
MHSLRTLGVIPYLGRCELCDSEYGGQVSLHDPDCISFAGHAAVALLTHTGISFHGVQSHVFHDSCTDTRSPSTVWMFPFLTSSATLVFCLCGTSHTNRGEEKSTVVLISFPWLLLMLSILKIFWSFTHLLLRNVYSELLLILSLDFFFCYSLSEFHVFCILTPNQMYILKI